jgi:hypothetical protein
MGDDGQFVFGPFYDCQGRLEVATGAVAAAGGWRDTETLLTSYQQPDDETLLAVMNEERKVRDRVQALG